MSSYGLAPHFHLGVSFVCTTTSKNLYNDQAEAIVALEQKKGSVGTPKQDPGHSFQSRKPLPMTAKMGDLPLERSGPCKNELWL